LAEDREEHGCRYLKSGAEVMTAPLDVAQHWSRRKILFILSNLDSFRAGIIPNYRATGYTSAEHTQRQIRQMAYFIPAVEMATEATMRVSRAAYEVREMAMEATLRVSRARTKDNNDGFLVTCIYEKRVEASVLARLLHCEERDIWRRVSRALRYAASDDCLILSYKRWRRENKK